MGTCSKIFIVIIQLRQHDSFISFRIILLLVVLIIHVLLAIDPVSLVLSPALENLSRPFVQIKTPNNEFWALPTIPPNYAYCKLLLGNFEYHPLEWGGTPQRFCRERAWGMPFNEHALLTMLTRSQAFINKQKWLLLLSMPRHLGQWYRCHSRITVGRRSLDALPHWGSGVLRLMLHPHADTPVITNTHM